MLIQEDLIIDEATVFLTSNSIDTVDTLLTAIQNDLLGTIKGDFTVKVEPLIREMEYAGKRGNTHKGDERILGYNVTGEGEFMNFNTKVLETSFLKKVTTTSTKYDKYVPKSDIVDADYKHLVVVGKLKGETEKSIMVIKNTMNRAGLEVTYKDSDEGATKMVFKGSYDGEDHPFEFFKPKRV